jgi:hypothetical protein
MQYSLALSVNIVEDVHDYNYFKVNVDNVVELMYY